MLRRKISPLVATIVGVFFVLTSLCFFAGSIYSYFHVRAFLRTAQKADGVVTKLVDQAGDYFPVFEFIDSQGQEHKVDSRSGSNPPDYQVGDKVHLLYDPNDPTDAETNSFWGIWIWPIALCGAGVFDLVFAVLFVLVSIFLQGMP